MDTNKTFCREKPSAAIILRYNDKMTCLLCNLVYVAPSYISISDEIWMIHVHALTPTSPQHSIAIFVMFTTAVRLDVNMLYHSILMANAWVELVSLKVAVFSTQTVCFCENIFCLHQKYAEYSVRILNPYSAGIDFTRQNLTSTDVRFERLNSIPALKWINCIMGSWIMT